MVGREEMKPTNTESMGDNHYGLKNTREELERVIFDTR